MSNQKHYFVIGGSSGINLAVVKNLISAGHQVFVGSRTVSDELKELDVQHIKLDVTDEPDNWDLSALPDTLHGLVYGAGTINLKPFQSLKITDFQKDLEINTLGAIKILQATWKKLKKSKNASVVMFSTVAVKSGMNFHASVAVAKAGIEGLTRSLSAEWAKYNIRVNAIAPSLTNTPLAKNLLSTEDKQKGAAQRHPLGRYGEVEDISEAVLYLLGDKASWMTGQILHIDGGMSATRGL